jgi:hypothetical protein
MRSLQEKFQISPKLTDDDNDKWLPWKPGRVAPALGNDRTQSESGENGWKSKDSCDFDTRRFNAMPPGMDIDNQRRAKIKPMPLVMSGESDVSKDTNDTSFSKGFTRRDMAGTDDQYTGEHMDLFYGDAGGFVERNNYLDRE